MKRILTGLLALSLIFGGTLYAQQGGIIFGGGNVTEIINPSSSGTHTLKTGGAHIAIDTSGLGYSILPKLTTAQRDAISPVTAGAMIYNVTVARYEYWSGTAWSAMGLAEADTLSTVVVRGRISANHGSYADRVQFTDSANGGCGFYTHATLGPQVVCWPASGVENDLNKTVNLNAAKTWELQSQAVAKARFTESTGVLEPVGTGQVKANRTTCTGTDYLKADGTCAAPGGGITVLDRDVILAEVVNSAVETTLYTFSVPAGTLSTNNAIRISVIADWLNNSAVAQTITLRMKYGATTFYTSNALSFGSDVNRYAVLMSAEIHAANSATAQYAKTTLNTGQPGNITGSSAGSMSNFAAIHNSMAIDSTLAQTLAITCENGVANVNVSCRVLSVFVEKIS